MDNLCLSTSPLDQASLERRRPCYPLSRPSRGYRAYGPSPRGRECAPGSRSESDSLTLILLPLCDR